MNQPSNPPKKKSQQPPSAKSSTADVALAALQQAIETIKGAQETNQRMLEREKPLIEFHQAVNTNKDGDLRLFWDVRLVRGVNTPFTQTTGTSALPGILSKKLLPQATVQIEHEVVEKIGGPLVAALMELIAKEDFGTLSRLAEQSLIAAPDEDAVQPRDAADIMASARRHERVTKANATIHDVETEEDDDQ